MATENFNIEENDVIVLPFTAANGQTEIAFDFPALDASHVKVFSRVVGSTEETELNQDTEFTVSGVGNATGGTVTLTTAADGSTIYAVALQRPYERDTDFANRGRITAAAMNRQLDALTQMVQQLARDVARSVRGKLTASALAAIIPVGDALIGFNAGATAIDMSLSRTEVADAIERINGFDGFTAETGSVLSVNTKAAIAGVNTEGAAFIRTAWYSSMLYGGGGLYGLHNGDGLTEPDGDARFKAESADGYWYALVPHADGLLASQCGAEARGSAHDDTADIQAGVDYILGANPRSTWSAGVVTSNYAMGLKFILDGKHYYCTDSIHATWGDTPRDGNEIVGTGAARRGVDDSTMAGTVVEFSSAVLDRMGFDIQGARGQVLRGMWLEGPLTATYQALDFNNGGHLDRANWANGSQTRTNACTGVCVDGRSGSKPGNAYPDQSMPAWTGSSDTYNLDVGTRPRLYDISGRGWEVMVSFGSGNASANTDFGEWIGGEAEYCRDVCALAHTQIRIPRLQGIVVNTAHTFLNADDIGIGTGRSGGLISNCGWGRVARLFCLSSSTIFGPTIFQCCYGEELYRISDESGGTTSDGQIIFDGGILSFKHGYVYDATDGNWGVPANLIESSGSTEYIFRGTRFSFPTMIGFDANVVLDDCTAISGQWSSSVADAFEAFVNNGTMGGVYCANISTQANDWSVRHPLYNVSTSSRVSSRQVGRGSARDNETGRDYCIPQDARNYRRGETAGVFMETNNLPFYTRDKANAGHITGCTLADRVLTLTLASPTDAFVSFAGLMPGDLIVDINTSAAFSIYSRSGNTVLARQETGFRAASVTPGDYTDTSGFSTSTGTLRFYNNRRYALSEPTIGTVTGASTQITNVRSANSNTSSGAGVIEEVTVNDYWADGIWHWGAYDEHDLLVSARSASGGTMDIATAPSAGWASAHNVADLTQFIRPGPANIGAPTNI